MYSEICSVHLTHPLLRISGQLQYSTRGPDPDFHQCIWSKVPKKKINDKPRHFFLSVDKTGMPVGN